MKNYKIIIQYDGSRYKGWQVQNSTEMTIQGKIQSVLSELAGESIEVIGSGRTDAGVHAYGQAADYMIGCHDFMAFCGNKKMKKSTVRMVTSINIEEIGTELRISYTGDGFLQNMIRIMTGTLIEVGNGTKQPVDILEILESKDRSKAGYTVPPEGLILQKVVYDL